MYIHNYWWRWANPKMQTFQIHLREGDCHISFVWNISYFCLLLCWLDLSLFWILDCLTRMHTSKSWTTSPQNVIPGSFTLCSCPVLCNWNVPVHSDFQRCWNGTSIKIPTVTIYSRILIYYTHLYCTSLSQLHSSTIDLIISWRICLFDSILIQASIHQMHTVVLLVNLLKI
jgi:hypothetical protein